jgi:hypothetical protein
MVDLEALVSTEDKLADAIECADERRTTEFWPGGSGIKGGSTRLLARKPSLFGLCQPRPPQDC